ncbi:2-oxoglutarate synthase subunit KorB [Methanothermobacter sp. CaT2]|jgi:2-oxoglutarate ferredoxin oxidoreductase subunit beta|uniref:2-oxoacid:ferredoxin oxidoreductase subunit beta n=1 Tax=Methanothermobacter thermautotrophicus TaxID=145262 RepID=A0A7J4MTQ8_METTF|nr:2-oxoglutarate synthase subunit KorB [Methanothermobacter sp. CaT2]MBC7111994.1 2-oxoacid:ferredoxin oxidoreductase subunit beta [Methanothermobacter sp.]HIH64141.1 2-oxoacid:ferredoxin oxidoreductase subunit beta [Methanothermobacter thermautotrophicus]MDK2875107.1 2-oxoglutarate/2-oxoacid ferredoxin oxidoreductase subunit beta [Methanothermobacter sp.]BAM70191.1 2-oxoglutarate ferredoxin oxidoreductase beta subunit [Methanothermobacter sp. CaT2]HIH71597.1 2-oxoacid:ferredoxin oxidoreducta
MEKRENPYLRYLRRERLPHIFCAGCGNGIVLNSFFKGMEMAGIDFENIAMVSGIGCSSRIPGYVNCDSLHTTHGRPISFATGLKLGNPSLDVVVFTGDGDAAAIGGNHLIHGARRNIDMTVICINNSIYGMTGGQISPTSPEGSYGSTAPYGALEDPFDLAELVTAAGASYVARWTTAHPLQLANSIKKGLKNRGFSFIEAISQCPTYFGRKNRMRSPVEMMRFMKENSLNRRKALKMEPDEVEGKIIVGEFANRPQPELCEKICSMVDEKSGRALDMIRSAYRDD